jgi:TrpR-related protein YerC/YecD
MKRTTSSKLNDNALAELCQALLLLKDTQELHRFLKDLCTPQEIKALAERWRVCKLLEQGTLSYRDINEITGASLVTIGRVARFLKTEPHQGYTLVLDRIKKKNTQGSTLKDVS